MTVPLPKLLRAQLDITVNAARDVAETAARVALMQGEVIVCKSPSPACSAEKRAARG